jgi:hypothetical protein
MLRSQVSRFRLVGELTVVGAMAFCSGWPAFSQTPTTPDMQRAHPTEGATDNRTSAAELTAAVAGRTDERAGTIVRRNLIDDYIFGKMEADGVPHAPLAGDTDFVRRVYLDLTGRIPTPDEVKDFVSSTEPGKRDALVDSLIGSRPFLSKWTYWFGDLARSNGNRIGNDGKNLFYQWTYNALQINTPYDNMVRHMLTAEAVSNWYDGPASYLARWVIIGATCADTVHEDTSDEIAVNSAMHFLGLNLQCVSCHDGRNHLEKVNLWLTDQKRTEFWQQAAFFGKTRVLRRTEVSTARDEYSIDDLGAGYSAAGESVTRVPRNGKDMIEPAFILSGEKPDPNKPLRDEFARMITTHPQFARATVNMFWAEMMGVGIVDPVFDFDLNRQDPNNPPPEGWSIQPSHPELLNALAEDFAENGYDLQRLLRLMATSSAYQLSSKFPGEWKASYAKYYARKFVRRLTSEELYDAIVSATNLFEEIPIRGTDLTVHYATETRSPEDMRRFTNAAFFLNVFGQTNRDYSERNNQGAIDQAIMLMNSPFVTERVASKSGSFLAELLGQQPALSDEQVIEELYYRFLSRQPEASETGRATALMAANRQQGLEDLQWLLMNKLDFIFND